MGGSFYWRFSRDLSRIKPVPIPRTVGTSRKQGQGKIRRARYGEGGSAPSLSSAPSALFASVFISLNITLLEPGTGYLSCDKNGNFVAAPYCERYHLFKSWNQAWDSSSTSRRKGCTGKQLLTTSPWVLRLFYNCLQSKIYKHLKF